MRIIVEVFRYSLAISITAVWTKWYLPVYLWKNNYLTSKEFTVSLFWLIHFSIRYPSKVNREIAKNYLPNAMRQKKV